MSYPWVLISFTINKKQMGIEKFNNTVGTAEINACGDGDSIARTSGMSSSMSSA